MSIRKTICLLLFASLTLGCSGGGGGGSSDDVTVVPPIDVPPVVPPAVPTSNIQSDIFESGPVRTTALSPDGSRLFVTNIASHKLEIFNVVASGIEFSASVAVGLEPVAVAPRSNTEVWVVNHLSNTLLLLMFH